MKLPKTDDWSSVEKSLGELVPESADRFQVAFAHYFPKMVEYAQRWHTSDPEDCAMQGLLKTKKYFDPNSGIPILACWTKNISQLAANEFNSNQSSVKGRQHLQHYVETFLEDPSGSATKLDTLPEKAVDAFFKELASLSPIERTLVDLRVFEGRTTREISHVLGNSLTERAIISRLYQVRKRLRAALDSKNTTPIEKPSKIKGDHNQASSISEGPDASSNKASLDKARSKRTECASQKKEEKNTHTQKPSHNELKQGGDYGNDRTD